MLLHLVCKKNKNIYFINNINLKSVIIATPNQNHSYSYAHT